jgi:hypothetical protein
LQVRGAFRGFEILSRGKGATLLINSEDERLPELFIRGAATYKAQLNAESPVGTMQSIEYALRSLDRAVEDEQERTARAEKMLGDFQEQAGRPYEHEARLKELLGRQAELNAALDLDKGERQIAAPAGDEENAGTNTDSGVDAVADEPTLVAKARAEMRSDWQRDLGGGDKRGTARRAKPLPGPKA